jgi:hypothetical protein
VAERNNPFIGESEIQSPLLVNLSRSPRVVNRNQTHVCLVKNKILLAVFGLWYRSGAVDSVIRGRGRDALSEICQVNIHRQNQWFRLWVAQCKLARITNAASILFGHLNGGHSFLELYLLQFLVCLHLVADVLASDCRIPAHCRNETTPGPEMLTDEIALALPLHPCHMDRALSFDVTYHLRYRVLRRYRPHHVHMI